MIVSDVACHNKSPPPFLQRVCLLPFRLVYRTMRQGRVLSSVCVAFVLLHALASSVDASEVSAEVMENGVTLVEGFAEGLISEANTSIAPVEAVEKEVPASSEETTIKVIDKHPVQTGPLIDLFGQQLLSLEMVDELSAELRPHFTSDALRGKKVIGVYFSADWCGPCRKFTPELVSFYNKMNNRRGKKGQFEIVWVSRCRDVKSYGQYFTHMGGWYALPPEEAMGERGTMLSNKYKVKGIPALVLLDDLGQVITTDARNKIPQDKAGIGFPWRNPLATLYMTLIPRSLRLMVLSQVGLVKDKFVVSVQQVVGRKKKAKAAQA
jgi:nucleoredoxin